MSEPTMTEHPDGGCAGNRGADHVTYILLEIEPDPDGLHCGDCHLVERGGWCSAFDRRLDGILGRWDCCPECLAARVPDAPQADQEGGR